MPQDPQDTQIIELIWQRSELGLAMARQKYGALCLSLACRLLPLQDAEECVSDSLLALWQQIPPQRPRALAPYLLGILRNLSLKRFHQAHAQKRSPEVLLSLDELAEISASMENLRNYGQAGPSAEDELLQKRLLASIEQFLRQQPPAARRLFLLRYWFFLPLSEIAAQLGTTPNAAAARLARLRAKLKNHLQKEDLI